MENRLQGLNKIKIRRASKNIIKNNINYKKIALIQR